MRKIAVCALIATVLTGCTPLRDVIWPTAVKCLSAPAEALVDGVKDIVARDGFDNVFSGDSLSMLEDLARSYGPEAVVCVLQALLDKYTAPTGMAAPPENLARARRIQDFLNERSITSEE